MDIDVSQTVQMAVTLLAPYLAKAGEAAAEGMGKAVPEKLGLIYQAIKRKVSADNDADAEKALQRLEEQPSSEARLRVLEGVLLEKAERDQEFARELLRLVEGAREDNSTYQFLTQVYGNAKVGKIINVGRADRVS